MNDSKKITEKVSKKVAQELLKTIYGDLLISIDEDEDQKKSEIKLVEALMQGRLEYKDQVFKLKLITPILKGESQVSELTICEPTGVQLRGMANVKDGDDIGRGMAILGEVTGLGLPIINSLKSRDLMTATGVLGLFL